MQPACTLHCTDYAVVRSIMIRTVSLLVKRELALGVLVEIQELLEFTGVTRVISYKSYQGYWTQTV